MRRRSKVTSIRIASPSSMPFALFDANFPSTTLFPPQHKKAFRGAVLKEILQERVPPRCGRHAARGVKRKMSKYRQIRSRARLPNHRPKLLILKNRHFLQE